MLFILVIFSLETIADLRQREWPRKTMIGLKTRKMLWIWNAVFLIDCLVSKNTAVLLIAPNTHTL